MVYLSVIHGRDSDRSEARLLKRVFRSRRCHDDTPMIFFCINGKFSRISKACKGRTPSTQNHRFVRLTIYSCSTTNKKISGVPLCPYCGNKPTRQNRSCRTNRSWTGIRLGIQTHTTIWILSSAFVG